MQLTFRHDLAFVTATLTYSGVSIDIENVLVDTGVASTIINADLAADAGVYVSPTDTLRCLRGAGGHEHVFARRVVLGTHVAVGACARSSRFSSGLGGHARAVSLLA